MVGAALGMADDHAPRRPHPSASRPTGRRYGHRSPRRGSPGRRPAAASRPPRAPARRSASPADRSCTSATPGCGPGLPHAPRLASEAAKPVHLPVARHHERPRHLFRSVMLRAIPPPAWLPVGPASVSCAGRNRFIIRRATIQRGKIWTSATRPGKTAEIAGAPPPGSKLEYRHARCNAPRRDEHVHQVPAWPAGGRVRRLGHRRRRSVQPGAGRSPRVGKTEITADEFRQAYQDETQSIARRLGRKLTPEQAKLLGVETRALARLIGFAALDIHARDLRLTVSENIIANIISGDPAFQADRAVLPAQVPQRSSANTATAARPSTSRPASATSCASS